MFVELYDERKDLIERIKAFKRAADVMLEKYGDGAAQHYNGENAITTYLWLRYPEKYYIYKFSEVKVVADKLDSKYYFKKGSYNDNLRNFFALYDEIRSELKSLSLIFRYYRNLFPPYRNAFLYMP